MSVWQCVLHLFLAHGWFIYYPHLHLTVPFWQYWDLCQPMHAN